MYGSRIKISHRVLVSQVPRLFHSKIRFGGSPHESVEIFVSSIQKYKYDYNITDELALYDFEEILYGRALDWWNNSSFSSWQEALDGINSAF